jgi:hypothetical protein
MLIELMQTVAIVDWSSWYDLGQHLQAVDPALIAQFQNNVFSNFNAALSNFIESGQVWAFIIGLVLGYIVRSFTSYG